MSETHSVTRLYYSQTKHKYFKIHEDPVQSAPADPFIKDFE